MSKVTIDLDDLELTLKRQIEDTLSARLKEFFGNKGYQGLNYVIETEVRKVTQELIRSKFKKRITDATAKHITKNLDKIAQAAVKEHCK